MLGGVLPAPFTGRVEVAPGSAVGAEPLIVLGVRRAEPLDPDLGSNRPELAPGVDGHRRILRLACTVGLEVVPATGQGRSQQLEGVQAALYALEAPTMRDGKALVEAGDAGFLIQQLEIVDAGVPFTTGAGPAPDPPGLTARAEGWFWPVGTPGQIGKKILEVHVRGADLQVELSPAAPVLTAGGPAVDLAVRVRAIGSLRITKDGTSALPFGRLAFFVAKPGGNAPGPGTLGGGAAGIDGVRVVQLADGAATVSYTPPGEAARAELVVAFEDGKGSLGAEVGRLPLAVKAG